MGTKIGTKVNQAEFFRAKSKILSQTHQYGIDIPSEYRWMSDLEVIDEITAAPVLSCLSAAIQHIAMDMDSGDTNKVQFTMLATMTTLYAIYENHFKKYGLPGEPMSFSDMTGIQFTKDTSIN